MPLLLQMVNLLHSLVKQFVLHLKLLFPRAASPIGRLFLESLGNFPVSILEWQVGSGYVLLPYFIEMEHVVNEFGVDLIMFDEGGHGDFLGGGA